MPIDLYFVGECADGLRVSVKIEDVDVVDGYPRPRCGMCDQHHLELVTPIEYEMFHPADDTPPE